MVTKQSAGLWFAAAICFVLFLLLVSDGYRDSYRWGWTLFMLGIVYLGAATRRFQSWAAPRRGLAWWALVAITLLMILLTFEVNDIGYIR